MGMNQPNSSNSLFQKSKSPRVMSATVIFLTLCLVCNGSTATDEGYDYYEYPDDSWNDPRQQATALGKNWSPAPRRRTFQSVVRDVITERQALFGLPIGLLVGAGGVSTSDIIVAWFLSPLYHFGSLLFIHISTNATEDHKYSPLPSADFDSSEGLVSFSAFIFS